jgi:hypothetical protein
MSSKRTSRAAAATMEEEESMGQVRILQPTYLEQSTGTVRYKC